MERPPSSPPSPISPGAGPALSASQPGPAPIDRAAPIGDTPSRSLDPSGSGLPERPSGPPVTAPPTAVRPDGEGAVTGPRPATPSSGLARAADRALGGRDRARPVWALLWRDCRRPRPPSMSSTLITTAKGRARIASLAQPSAPPLRHPSAGGGASGLHAGSGPGAAGPGRAERPWRRCGPRPVPAPTPDPRGRPCRCCRRFGSGPGGGRPARTAPSAWPPRWARPARTCPAGYPGTPGQRARSRAVEPPGYGRPRSVAVEVAFPVWSGRRHAGPRPVAGWSGPPEVHGSRKSAGWSGGATPPGAPTGTSGRPARRPGRNQRATPRGRSSPPARSTAR